MNHIFHKPNLKRTLLLLTLLLFLSVPAILISLQKHFAVRVACVGDSITYGAKIDNRAFRSYPARLQQLLGGGYLVKNFGASGYTLQKDGNFPYWNHPNFKKSTDFQPDIVLIMLGTNDTKPYNWKGTEEFLTDYRALIHHYRSLESRPQIILMTPATVYPENFQPSHPYNIQADIADLISSEILKLAEEEHLPVIDIHQATAAHPEYFLLDGVHPDSSGAEAIASLAAEALRALR